MKVVEQRLEHTPVVPLVQADDPAVAVRVAHALVAGGLTVIEVVFRTDAALACLEAVGREVPEAVVGAGTVLTEAQARAAADAGARFIVSPGLDEAVVSVARERDLPAFPGVVTATELQRAYNLGLRTVKFFPASAAGGIPTLKALAAPFREMRFMPTGGVSAANLADWLALPQVVACGGSWLTPAAAIAAGEYSTITNLAAEACRIAASGGSRNG
ncbi:MAG TPA: bifunctional 4-hydroxy-2-oxoglutarate aldolase/2-dehydro-3-deoxy-phosphogluconate aldolase [Woeseiaceae bacterium]|nr:bifunctional 4-hydroxy-2-oxoglutarate aldolase/2-dehydro-3-deoxy-phosphogluconate aldolase [Woeseiaceae bacterium]